MAPYRRTARSIRKTTTAPRDKAWAVMRALQLSQGGFTIPEVLTAAEILKPSFLKYLKALRNTGYVVMTEQAKKSKGIPARFRLVRNTGPFRPHAQSNGVVYDRNLAQEFAPAEEVSHDA